MKRDPIVEEIRQTRQKMLDDCGGDLRKLMQQFKDAEGQDRERLVSGKIPSEEARRRRAGAEALPETARED